jgi:hypothetical protein
MDTKYNAIQYLNNHTFIPHTEGNYARYGLNLFGCDSIIQYNNHYWKFMYFIPNSNIAVYTNKNGEEFFLNDYIDGIIRMQEA